MSASFDRDSPADSSPASDPPAEVNPSPAPWQTLSRELHADCRVFRIWRKRCRHPRRGTEDDFYLIEARDWVVAIALTPEDRLVLVHQYRFGSDSLSWELPAGCLDPGEDPAEAAARELREETGYVGDPAELLAVNHPNPALQDNRCFYFLIRSARLAGPVAPDGHEEIEVGLADWREAVARARRGEMHHALAANALFFLEGWMAGRTTVEPV